MDHDLCGVAFRVTGMRADIAGRRVANGAELLRACSFTDLRALRGCDVPGVGVIVDVGSPKLDQLPVGQVVNLVTARIPVAAVE